MLKGEASDDLAQASKALNSITAALKGSQDQPLTAALANFANRLAAAANVGSVTNGTAVARRDDLSDKNAQLPGPGGFPFGGGVGGGRPGPSGQSPGYPQPQPIYGNPNSIGNQGPGIGMNILPKAYIQC